MKQLLSIYHMTKMHCLKRYSQRLIWVAIRLCNCNRALFLSRGNTIHKLKGDHE